MPKRFQLPVILAALLFAGSAAAAPVIKVLSNRADLVSGGDALVEITGVMDAGSTQVRLNGKDVSGSFAMRDNGRYMGLIEGLPPGENKLRVAGAGGASEVVIRNHPNHGPVFSAGQHRLVACDAQGERPADCDLQVSYAYYYKSSNPSQPGLIAFDPQAGVPGDVVMTTTQTGKTLPFVVRRENGFQDRDRYTFLVLFDLDAVDAWTPWNPQAQWNRKMLIPHGGGCDMSFEPAQPPLGDTVAGSSPINSPGAPENSYVHALGLGFAVMSTALNNNGHNCDHVLQAESMVMAKERFIEQYGELRYTIGTGCSGGSITQNTVANAYPGVYQGLLTTCNYPDSISPAVQAADYSLMRTYFEDPSRWGPGVVWSPHQFGLVEGHLTHVNAVAMDTLLYQPAVSTSDGCAGEATYHPQNNPTGIRCGAIEWYKHVWGTRKALAMTGDIEIEVSNIPAGNTGIQYGLQALQQSEITPAQFVDLNQKIGGFDYDMRLQAERSQADSGAIAAARRSGAVTVGNHLNRVAIINFLGPDPGAAHDSVHAWWSRWRLDLEHGHHDNHVMWGGPVALIGDPYYFVQGLLAMDRWLAAVEADDSTDALPLRIVANRPEDVHDQCSDGLGHKVADEICVEFLRYPYAYGTPRTVAGANKYAANFACQLKPLSREANYGPVPFTDDQWAQLEALFADGVCDYQKPGQGEETKTTAWLTYQDDRGDVVVGGRELGPRQENSMEGWAAPEFR